MPQSTLDTKIAVLEKSVQSMTDLFSRLDLAIERIGEVSNSINQLLAVHEQKIAQTQEDTGDLFKLVEKRRVEVDAGARELHSRISSQHRDIKEEIREDYKRLEGHIGEIKIMLTGTKIQTDHSIEQIETRLRNMEKKQWIIIGAASLAGLLLGNLDIIQNLLT